MGRIAATRMHTIAAGGVYARYDGVEDRMSYEAPFACMKNRPGKDPSALDAVAMDSERDDDLDRGGDPGFQIALKGSLP